MAFEDTPDNPTAAAKSNASSALETHKNLEMAQPNVTVHNDTSVAPFTIWLSGNNYSWKLWSAKALY
ncbi:unnamed protein product [Prunus armeniaca]